MGPFVQRDNLGGKRATIGMASRCRDEVMIAAMIVARKSFVGSDCRGASISGGFGCRVRWRPSGTAFGGSCWRLTAMAMISSKTATPSDRVHPAFAGYSSLIAARTHDLIVATVDNAKIQIRFVVT